MSPIKEGLILGCCNPLLDISAQVDDALLEKYGLKPNDAILAEPKHLPLYDELIEKFGAEFIAGGSGQNTLRVCQWVLQKPNVTVFFGCVGKDKYSEILEKKARADGVNVQYQYNPNEQTGTCAVAITGPHRSLCANLAAANHFTIDHLEKPENKALIDNAECFYITGFFLTVSPPAIMTIATHAHEHNRPFMMNLSALFISQFYLEPLMEALPYVDVLFGNETEAEGFGKSQQWDTNDLKEIGKRIVNLPKKNDKRKRIVIITQGQLPVLLIQKDSIEEFPVEKLEREQIVDTNGAGDAFVGGFLSQFIQKKPLDVCVRCAMWTAKHIIQRSGCTFEGIPDFKE